MLQLYAQFVTLQVDLEYRLLCLRIGGPPQQGPSWVAPRGPLEENIRTAKRKKKKKKYLNWLVKHLASELVKVRDFI